MAGRKESCNSTTTLCRSQRGGASLAKAAPKLSGWARPGTLIDALAATSIRLRRPETFGLNLTKEVI